MQTIRAAGEVSEDGQSFTAEFTIEFTGEGAPSGEYGPGHVTGTRINVEPMGTPAGSLEDLFAQFEEGTAPAGTAPVGTASAGTEPAGTTPAGTEPAGTEPAGPPGGHRTGRDHAGRYFGGNDGLDVARAGTGTERLLDVCASLLAERAAIERILAELGPSWARARRALIDLRRVMNG